ncbi:hypothetical protein RWE15_13205 [Virgibacillus halophilus]|uniref:TcaA second domain-containing protein n=1 Tax=Tigheibacillus halophilus TaxID=361280 RepID=A0ABU5C7A4_9BACI|nr:hypothetical protein [Virgibacillus halophilus]
MLYKKMPPLSTLSPPEPFEQEMKPRRKISKKWIILGSAIIVFIILFSSAYAVGSSRYKPDSKIDSFDQAVKDKDIQKVKSMLTSDDDDLKITTDNTKKFVHYLEEHPDQLQSLIEKMKQQVKSKTADTYSYGKYATINIEKRGKKWALFNDYKLSIVPAFVKATANQDDIDFYVDDTKMGSSKRWRASRTWSAHAWKP